MICRHSSSSPTYPLANDILIHFLFKFTALIRYAHLVFSKPFFHLLTLEIILFSCRQKDCNLLAPSSRTHYRIFLLRSIRYNERFNVKCEYPTNVIVSHFNFQRFLFFEEEIFHLALPPISFLCFALSDQAKILHFNF